MADSEIDTTQQATSETPPPQKQKNPKRVAAGKLIAEKTRQAREAQKKKLAEYEARENDGPPAPAVAAPAVAAPAVAAPAVAAPAVAAPAVAAPPVSAQPDGPTETTTLEWLTGIGIIVSAIGLYYKREEIKNLLPTKKPQAPPSPVLPRAPPPSPVLPRASRPSPVLPPARRLRKMH